MKAIVKMFVRAHIFTYVIIQAKKLACKGFFAQYFTASGVALATKRTIVRTYVLTYAERSGIIQEVGNLLARGGNFAVFQIVMPLFITGVALANEYHMIYNKQ